MLELPYVKSPSWFRWIAAILVVCAALQASDDKSAAKKKKDASKSAGTETPATDLVWPLPPELPRIRWLAAYSDLTRVKNPVAKKAGWLDKVTGTKTIEERMELNKPYGITTDRRGRIYTADSAAKVVFIIDPEAKVVEKRTGDARTPLVIPVGVAVDADDRLFVSDAALHSVILFSPSGQTLANIGSAALGRPGAIAIDRDRHRLYVPDAKESRIAVFDTVSLKFLNYIGSPSTPGKPEPGRFSSPTNVAVDRQGNLYVADTWNYRVQIFDVTGKFVRMFGTQGDSPGEFLRPKGIAVDSEGHIYVADAEFNCFQILSQQGRTLLAVGVLGTNPGQFLLLTGLYIDAKDRIYTTENYQGRVQVFQYIPQPGSSEYKEVSATANR